MFYIKFDLKNKKDRWLLVLFSTAAAIFLGLLTSGTLKMTTYPYFCTVCHEMNPEYQTWSVSSHSSISCGACHVESGIKGLVNYEKNLLNNLKKHFNGKYYPPITLKAPIPQERCLKCHTTYRKVTPRGDIIIPHDKHRARNIACNECHRGVAHGNIANRGLTEDKFFEAWNPVMAKNEMGAKNTGLPMQGCLECHQSLGVKTTCEDCHGVIKKPVSHVQPDFAAGHGKKARDSLKECNTCHSFSKTYVSNDASESLDPVGNYARENNFCTSCHLKKPAGHTPNWRSIHGQTIKKIENRASCIVCHDENTRNKSSRAAQPSCNSCHSNKHSDSWRVTHTNRVSKLEFSQGCFQCHPSTLCGKCHDTSFNK